MATLPREDVWCAQTPQMFRYKLLRESIKNALLAGYVLTDEASALEQAGHGVQLVQGNQHNIKITVHQDMALAQHYLSLCREAVDV